MVSQSVAEDAQYSWRLVNLVMVHFVYGSFSVVVVECIVLWYCTGFLLGPVEEEPCVMGSFSKNAGLEQGRHKPCEERGHESFS